MFEHFTFGAQAQTNHHEDISASPTDTSFPSPIEAPPASVCPFESWEAGPFQEGMNDIVNQLSSHSLLHDSEEPQASIWRDSQPLSPAFDPFTEEELSYVSTTRGMAIVHHSTKSMPNTPLMASSHSGTLACRRLQRQLNVQLQSSANHTRDINALVESMIVNNSQCNLRKSTSRPYLLSLPSKRHDTEEPLIQTTEVEAQVPTLHEDEGFGDFDDPSTLMKEEVSLRRASTPTGIRKHSLRYRASAECVGSNVIVGPNGRLKVRSVPRMRKRKVVRVPE